MAKTRVVKRHNAAFWEKIIAEYHQSKEQLNDFCKQRGLAQSTFHRWRAHLRDSESAVPEFLPVQVVDHPEQKQDPEQEQEDCVLEIVFPHGVRIRVPAQVNAESLKKVLRALEAAKC